MDRGPASPGPARPRAAAPHLGLPRRWEPWEISITLHPATAQDQDSQYVRFTLVLSVPPQVGRRPCTPAPDLSASLVVLCVFLFFPSIPTKLRKSRSGTRGDCQMSKFKSECQEDGERVIVSSKMQEAELVEKLSLRFTWLCVWLMGGYRCLDHLALSLLGATGAEYGCSPVVPLNCNLNPLGL